METVCASSAIDDKRRASGRKMADFMMDGVCFKGLCTFSRPSDRFSYDLVMDGPEKGKYRSIISISLINSNFRA